MASIIISGEIMENVPEVRKMIDNLLKGKIGISQFIKFINDNNLETKVRCVKSNINPSVLADFAGDTLSSIFSVPEKTEHEDIEENNEYKEVEDDECKNEADEWKIPDEFWKKTNEAHEKDVKNTLEFIKRLVDEYDASGDDIDHTKAIKLFHSLIVLRKTYRQRAFKGDERYNIQNFTPESILKFIETLDLPTDKIRVTVERGRAYYYKMKIYQSFEEFEKNMKDTYGIEDVWNPPKEIPDWFESVRDNTYRKFHNDELLEPVDEDEWNEFKKWKENKDKEDSSTKVDKLFRDILNTKPNLNIHELVGINELAMKGCVKGLEECLDCLKKSKDASIINTILKYNKSYDENCTSTDKKNDNKKSFEDQCRHIVDDIINKFSPILTGDVLKYFENKYKSNEKLFMNQLKGLYKAVKSAKNDGLICYIDVNDGTIICNPIPNTKKDIEEIILDTSYKSDTKGSLDKKSSTSKKTTTSASAKNDKTSAKKTTTKSSKTDTETKVKEFKKYADYILSNSIAENDARDLLLSYAANMDIKCKQLYNHLVELKKNNETVKLVKHIDEETGKKYIGFDVD